MQVGWESLLFFFVKLYFNSNFIDILNWLNIYMYMYTEKMHWRHLRDIRANKPSAAEQVDQLPNKILGTMLRWGETLGTHDYKFHIHRHKIYVSVTVGWGDILQDLETLFATRGRQTQAMINLCLHYSKVASEAINSRQQ